MHNADELNQFLASVEKRAFAMSMVTIKNVDDALDVVQDVMLTLARKYADKPSDQWAPLFFRILRNRITDFHRRSSTRRGLFAWFDRTTELDPVEQAAAPHQDTPDERSHLDEATQAIHAALQQLPARQREAFMLRAWEGLDVKQTAVAMQCSAGSVKTHYSRAVHTLREHLQEFELD